jgi:hypothetical protein
MKINKQAQLTLFIIFGIVIIAGIISIFYVYNNQLQNRTTSLTQITSELQKDIEDCLEKETITFTEIGGLDQEKLKEKLEQTLPRCIDPLINKLAANYQFNKGQINISTTKNKDNLFISLDYPINIKKGDEEYILKKFEYNIPLEYYVPLTFSENCILEENVQLDSFDKKFKIRIIKGTSIKDSNGNCLNRLGIKIIDPFLEYDRFDTSLTRLEYIPMPLGAIFEFKPSRITLSYTEDDYRRYSSATIENNHFLEDQEDLKINYYNPFTGLLQSYRTFGILKNEVNINSKIITADVDWFMDNKIPSNSECLSNVGVIIMSPDKKVELILEPNTMMKKTDGSCVETIDIKQGPKKSPVVNFGDKDYLFYPAGATFSPEIIYKYKYSIQQIQSPEFLYSSSDWKKLIDGTWENPIAPAITGNVINNQNRVARKASELKIAYYEESSGIYRPVETQVDEDKKTINAKLGHFSIWISAMGCEDTKYIKYTPVGFIEPDEAGLCNNSNPNNPLIGEFSFEIKKDNTCTTEQGLFPTIMATEGDIAVLEEYPSSCTGSCSVKFELTDVDLEYEGDNCASADLYIKFTGIGMEIPNLDIFEALKKIRVLTKEQYEEGVAKAMGNCTLSNNFCCDETLDACGQNLCQRCAQGTKCGPGDTEQTKGWSCSKSRVENCVKDHACKSGSSSSSSSSGSTSTSDYTWQNNVNIAGVKCIDLGTIKNDSSEKIVISSDGLCFQTKSGKPFFPIADTAWWLYRQSNEDIEHYIKTRSEQGFNVIKFGPDLPINPQKLNFILDTLEKYNMYVELGVGIWDYDNEKLAIDAKNQAIQIVTLAKDRNNIFAYTIDGLDSSYGKANIADTIKRKLEIYNAIKPLDPNRLFNFFPRSGHSIIGGSGMNPNQMDFYPVHKCCSYDINKLKSMILQEYNRNPKKPVFLTEPVYEGTASAIQIFGEIMTAIESGAAGISYGHIDIWSFKKDSWKTALNSEGTQKITQLVKNIGVNKQEIEKCEVYTKKSPQIERNIWGLTLSNSKGLIVNDNPAYTSLPWLSFHRDTFMELKGTGYLVIQFEDEGFHRPEGRGGDHNPPLFQGDITYIGDLPIDKPDAPRSIAHHWPDSTYAHKIYCVAGTAKITNRVAGDSVNRRWYNIMAGPATPGCSIEGNHGKVIYNPTSFAGGPTNKVIADKCKSLQNQQSPTNVQENISSPGPLPMGGNIIFSWDGYNKMYINPSTKLDRVWWVTNTAPNGQKYDWRSGQYHRILQNKIQPPSNGVVIVQDPRAIASEGIVQVCSEHANLRKLNQAWCWLIRPGIPVSSTITENQWRSKATDNVVLVYGKDG